MFRRLARRISRVAAASLFVGLACIAGGAGVIAVSPAPQPPGAEAAARDLRLTIQARRALLEDPDLALLNVGVRVRNRVAFLWGPVPSVESGFKAEVCVRALIEVVEVRNHLFVNELDVPTGKPAQPFPATLLPPAIPPALPGLPSDKLPSPPPSSAPPPPSPSPAVEPPPVEAEIELPPMRLPQPKTSIPQAPKR
jgi:hypothetical protein